MQSKHILTLCLLVASMSALSASAAAPDATEKDEARWTTPDTTPQQRYETAKKEANAAYQMVLGDCRALSGKEKSDCTKEAKTNYDHDLAEAKKQLSQ
jgi:hypothetical protein